MCKDDHTVYEVFVWKYMWHFGKQNNVQYVLYLNLLVEWLGKGGKLQNNVYTAFKPRYEINRKETWLHLSLKWNASKRTVAIHSVFVKN